MKTQIINRFVALSLLALAALHPQPTFAQPAAGSLDPTFAGSGMARVGFPGGYQRCSAAAVQADGKLVLVGERDSYYREFEIVRLDTNNALDASFGAGGAVFAPFSPTSKVTQGAGANAVGIQADDKIVVAGQADRTGFSYDFALARYNPDGSPDGSFGGGGEVLTDFGTSSSIKAILIQGDGKIVVAGHVGGNFALARYDTNGVLDASFGNSGTVMTDVGGLGEATALLIDPLGRYVAVGTGMNGSDFAVVCYTTNGVLDTTFGGTGKIFTSIPGYSHCYATAIGHQPGNNTVLDPDRLVVAGECENSNDTVYAVARYNLDGSLDTNFAGTGFVTGQFESGVYLGSYNPVHVWVQRGVFHQPAKITVTGTSVGPFIEFGLARYTTTGALDTTFAYGTGQETFSFGPLYDCVANALTLQSGKLVLAGSSAGNDDMAFAAARFNSDGSVDTAFGSNGVVTADVCGPSIAHGVGIQSDGKIVVAGERRPLFSGSLDLFALARFNPDGSLDNAFGANGRVTTQVGTTNAVAQAVAIQPDGKIVAAGQAAGAWFALARYTANGAPDAAFGSGGQVITQVGIFGGDIFNAVTLQRDGKIVAAGSTFELAAYDFAIVRYTTNGALDPSFGGGTGTAIATINGSYCFANGVQVQSDGKIVAAGYTSAGATTNFALVRLNPDGSLDNSFGSFGRVSTSFGSGTIAYGNALALQPDGKIVVAGQLLSGGIGYVAAARYHPNGTLDNTFGTGGLVTTQVGLINDSGTAVSVLPNGKIIIAGTSYQGGFPKYEAIRYNPDGSLDNTYGFGGEMVVSFGDGYDYGNAVALDQIGRAVIAGSAGALFGVARLASEPFLKITSINSVANGQMMLRGLGVPEGTHTLLTSPNVAAGSFTPLDSVMPDAGGFWQYQDTNTVGVSSRFYRLSYP